MAQQILRPSADTAQKELLPFPPGEFFHYRCVDEVISDGDSTYLHSAVERWDLFELPNPSLSGTINHVRVYIKCKHVMDGSAKAWTEIKTEGAEARGVENVLPDVYTDYFTQYNVNPTIGGAWTWIQINALQAGVRLWSDKGEGYCTQVWVVVDYTPPAADPRKASFFKMF